MTVLGIAMIVAGLILICSSMIVRFASRHEPASSQQVIEERLFRINDEMREE